MKKQTETRKKHTKVTLSPEFKETLDKLKKKIEYHAWDSTLPLSYPALIEILNKRIIKTKFLDYDVIDYNNQ